MALVNVNTSTYLQKGIRRLAKNAYATLGWINEFDFSLNNKNDDNNDSKFLKLVAYVNRAKVNSFK